MIKRALLSTTLILWTGCGEESHNASAPKATATTTPALQIEIVTNHDPKAIKVQAHKLHAKDQNDTYYYDYNIKSEYDQNAQPANHDASVRVKPRTAVEANMNIRSPYEKVQLDMLVGKLSRTFRVKCSACHDDYANGVIGPSLLSKNSDEIFNAIADFKSGKKSNPLMDGLIDHMSEDEIRALADEIFAFNQKIQAMRSR